MPETGPLMDEDFEARQEHVLASCLLHLQKVKWPMGVCRFLDHGVVAQNTQPLLKCVLQQGTLKENSVRILNRITHDSQRRVLGWAKMSKIAS